MSLSKSISFLAGSSDGVKAVTQFRDEAVAHLKRMSEQAVNDGQQQKTVRMRTFYNVRAKTLDDVISFLSDIDVVV